MTQLVTEVKEEKEMKYVGILAIACVSVGCAARAPIAETVVISGAPAPGTVETIWEEPMVDVIEVPPGLDPEGMYYRPAHQAVVEIRQGRWRYDQSK
jgi:hypothetical protein